MIYDNYICRKCSFALECYKRQVITIHYDSSLYRAMHFSAKRGIAIACRLSVRPSVCL